jgi:CBS domain-containing protein
MIVRRRAMKVRDIMTTHVQTCRTDTDLATAGKAMWQGGFGALPVVESNGSVAGILTDRDIALALASRQRNAAHVAVHEVMTKKVHSCFANDEIPAVLRLMENARVRRLPVLDERLHLAGIVSIDDIARSAVDQRGGVTAASFAGAMRRIAILPGIEPEVDFSESYVSG